MHESFEAFLNFKNVQDLLDSPLSSEDLIDLALCLEEFLVDFFAIQSERNQIKHEEESARILYSFKRFFVQRHLKPRYEGEPLPFFRIDEIKATLTRAMGTPFQGEEALFAFHVSSWLENPTEFQKELHQAELYGAWALFTKEGQEAHRQGTLFHLPKPKNAKSLFQTAPQGTSLKSPILRNREGFDLTESPCSKSFSQDQAHYCLVCHRQGKDSCRTGLSAEKSPTKSPIEGCPLDQRISEMMAVKAQGFSIAALAIITRDNPMVAATGRRICNACSAACIFQKQDPVDVPSVETEILETVLKLPWGFEIYSLLTRWNPLRENNPLPLPSTQKKILVVGMGPAGIALSHHLLNDGHTVVGIDGMAITPLPAALKEPDLIRQIMDFFEPLDQRTIKGFGGVAEYGITARWNKNFLLVLRLLLERRDAFLMLGHTRLESSITTDQAFSLGFDHVSLCLGAGKTKLPKIQNLLADGVLQAPDFLMRLHVTGLAQRDRGYPPLIRLPVIVIGSGLTAVDAATEALAYYPKQVEAFLCHQEKNPVQNLAPHEQEFLDHAKYLREERLKASQENRKPRIQELLWSWGGVTLLYRRTMQESPAYRTNASELQKALEEGVLYLEEQSPEAFLTNNEGRVCAIKTLEGQILPTKTILVATGTFPNTVIHEENPSLFQKKGEFLEFQKDHSPFTVSRFDEHRFITALGDLHPDFTGSVVHALASAKQAAPIITEQLKANSSTSSFSSEEFFTQVLEQLVPTVRHLTNEADGVRLTLHAPLMAKNTKPGHFFRLQIPETPSTLVTIPLMGVPSALETLQFFIKYGPKTSQFLQSLKPGNIFPLMGPTGSPLSIPRGHHVLLRGESFHGTTLEFMKETLENQGCKVSINGEPSSQFDTVLIIGSVPLLQHVLENRTQLKKEVVIQGILPSPFQCMMKGICAQCLRQETDPKTGVTSFVFSCEKSVRLLSDEYHFES